MKRYSHHLNLQTIDILWHLIGEEGIKEKFIEVAKANGELEDTAKDLFIDTQESLKFYYHELFKRLPEYKRLIVEE
jgi:hypothetical protein